MTTRLFLLLLLAFWAGAVRCEPPALIDAENGWVPEVQILEDASGQLTPEEVARPEARPLFRNVAASGASLNFGFTSSVYWLHLRLSQAQKTPTQWLLELANASVAEVDFYAPGQAPVYTGRRRPLDSLPMYDR